MKKQILFSFIFNLLGLFSIFFIDLQIAKMNDDLLVSSWALTKSTLFIGLIFVLLGLDQAIVRMKLSIEEIVMPATLQFIILAALVTLFVRIIGITVDIPILVISLSLLAMLYLYYAEHRLNLKYTKAQFSANGWKFIFLCLAFVLGFTEYIYALPLALIVSFFIIFINRGAFTIYKKVQYRNYKSILTTGLHYFTTLLTLTLTLYVDQVILSADGRINESSILFSHITFFVSPNAILIGFGGFLLVPYLKKQPENKAKIFKKYFWFFLGIISVIVILSNFVGFALFSYFKPGQTPSLFLAVGLSIVAFLRYLYILPSSYVGSFASNKLIRKVSFFNMVGIVLYIIVYISLSRYLDNYLVAILSAILSVWTVRIINEYKALFEIIRE